VSGLIRQVHPRLPGSRFSQWLNRLPSAGADPDRNAALTPPLCVQRSSLRREGLRRAGSRGPGSGLRPDTPRPHL